MRAEEDQRRLVRAPSLRRPETERVRGMTACPSSPITPHWTGNAADHYCLFILKISLRLSVIIVIIFRRNCFGRARRETLLQYIFISIYVITLRTNASIIMTYALHTKLRWAITYVLFFLFFFSLVLSTRTGIAVNWIFFHFFTRKYYDDVVVSDGGDCCRSSVIWHKVTSSLECRTLLYPYTSSVHDDIENFPVPRPGS